MDEDIFNYHKATEDQRGRIERVRKAAYALACAIEEGAPACADRSAAVRKVREAMMTANAAIVLEGAV